MDCAVILRESGRQELAHQFLDYLLRPKVSADIAACTKTATANGAGQALLPEAIRNERRRSIPRGDHRQGRMAGHTCRRPRRSCAIGSGPKSSQRKIEVICWPCRELL